MHNNDFDILLRSVQYLAFLCFFLFVVWPNSGHFWGVYQSHCASEGAFLFSFIYVMYLNIASYFYGKQIRSKLGNMLYLWMIFICVTIGLHKGHTMILNWKITLPFRPLKYSVKALIHRHSVLYMLSVSCTIWQMTNGELSVIHSAIHVNNHFYFENLLRTSL